MPYPSRELGNMGYGTIVFQSDAAFEEFPNRLPAAAIPAIHGVEDHIVMSLKTRMLGPARYEHTARVRLCYRIALARRNTHALPNRRRTP